MSVRNRLEKFYSAFAEKWLHEQGRDFFFLGSVFLLLSVASVGLFSDFVMSAAGCACYWLSFSLYGFTRYVEFPASNCTLVYGKSSAFYICLPWIEKWKRSCRGLGLPVALFRRS